MSRGFVVLLLAVLAVAGVACGNEESNPPPTDRDAERGIEPLGKDFFFDPARYIGREMTVTGYVSDLLTPVAFRIAGERFEGGGILVVSDDRLPRLDDGDLVQISGIVRPFKTEEFARQLGVVLDPVTFHQFEGGVAVAARNVVVNGIRP